MKNFWLTLGTLLSAVWGVNHSLQYATAQSAAAAPPSPTKTIVGAGGAAPYVVVHTERGTDQIYSAQPTLTGPGPAGVTLVAPPAAGEGGFYGQPTFSGMVSVFAGEGQSEEMQALMQKDAELEAKVQEGVSVYSDPNADSNAREEVREGLVDLLGQQFNARQERREMEIKQIEERVRKLREALDKRTSAKDKIIERRLNDLLTDAEGLGWGDAAPGTPGSYPGRFTPYGPGMGRQPGTKSPYGPSSGREERGGSPYGARSGGRSEGGSGGRYGGYPQPTPAPASGRGGEPQPSQNDPAER